MLFALLFEKRGDFSPHSRYLKRFCRTAAFLAHLPFIRVFIDEILVFSSTEEDHAHHLSQLLEQCRNINFEKSNFFQSEVRYLGHILNQDGIRPDITRIGRIHELNAPKPRRQLLKLFGFINWFRPFIRGLSNRISRLTQKIKKNTRFECTVADKKIVEDTVDEIAQQTLLATPDLTKPFVLEVDASDMALGAALRQGDRLIALFSKSLTNSQKNYTTTEKELLAAVEAIKHFHTIIFGSKVTIRTDHANLLPNPGVQTSRVQRWKLVLADYDLAFQHCPGHLCRRAVPMSANSNRTGLQPALTARFRQTPDMDPPASNHR